MTTPHALVVRLPSGTEYWYAQEVPEVGEFVAHLGTRYVVVTCDESEEERVVVTLAPAAEAIAASPPA